jgi:hypothetical protein
MRRTAGVLAFWAMATIAANAQESASTPVAEVGMNFSTTAVYPGGGTPSFTATGGSGSFVYNINKTFGAVADLGGYHNGSDGNLSPTTFSYLFGPRLSLRKKKVTPYVQALFGGVRVTSNFVDPNTGASAAQNAFAAAFGGGMDVRVSDHVYLKPFQVEYMMTRVPNLWSSNNMQNNLRYSAGIVFRIGSK